MTLWHEACEYGNESIVEVMIRRDWVNINARDLAGRTAVHFAATSPYPRVLSLLIAGHAQLDLIDSSSSTPLDVAIDYKNEAGIRLLWAAGAVTGTDRLEATMVMKDGSISSTPTDSAARNPRDIDSKNTVSSVFTAY